MTLYQVGFDQTQPTQIVFAAALRPANRQTREQTIANRDPGIQCLIATSEPHQQPDFSSDRVSIVDPLSSVVVNGTQDVWAVGNPAGGLPAGGQTAIQVDVIDTGIESSGSALAIGTALVTSGLAAQIAQQIAATGIPIIPAPQVIYNL
jgi:hypothetical protein